MCLKQNFIQNEQKAHFLKTYFILVTLKLVNSFRFLFSRYLTILKEKKEPKTKIGRRKHRRNEKCKFFTFTRRPARDDVTHS